MGKTIKALVSMFLLVATILCVAGCGQQALSEPEKSAARFIDCLYSGDGQGFVDLMSDDLVEQLMETYDYKTEELLVYAYNKELADEIEDRKWDFGNNWKYEISVIDSYQVETPKEYNGYEVIEVCLKVEHTGRKLLLFKVDETEEFEIQMIKIDTTWYVLAWEKTVI